VPPAERRFLWAAAILGLLVCGWLARPFAGSILTAATLAVALAPVEVRLRRWCRSATWSSFLTVVLFGAMVVVPVALLSLALAGDMRALLSGAGKLDWLDALLSRYGWSMPDLRVQLEEQILQSGRAMLSTAVNVAAGVGGGIASAFITLFTLYYFLREGRVWLRAIVSWAPLRAPEREQLLDVVHQTILANVYGVLAVALAQGTLALAGYWWAGLPSALLWAVLTGVFSLIPVVGTGLIWVPAVLYLLAQGHTGKAIFLAIWCGALVAWADNFVRPYVISDKVQISPLLILFALLGGVQAFGLVGLFAGPVVVALTGAILRLLRSSRATA